MGRLKSAPNRLEALPPRLATAPAGKPPTERERSDFNPLRKLYRTARWAKLRWAIFVRDLFTCQMCGRIEANTSRLVCDHRQPHRGDLALFWDPENLQTLCASPCHSKHKQKLEQAPGMR